MSIEPLPAARAARAPWNKGRIVGQKRPRLPKHVWSIRVRLEMADNNVTLPYSTWPWTANYEAVIWSVCGSMMSTLLDGSKNAHR